jgi:hypothetical protein
MYFADRDKKSRLRQLVAVLVAAGILAAIFVPFQKANAFTINLALPDVPSSNTLSQNTAGDNFRVAIKVEAGELVSISSIEVILDNTRAGVKRAIFGSNGQLSSGDNTIVKNNLLTINATASSSGYGYGYGIVSSGTTFSAPHSYSFAQSSDFIGGNSLGSSNAAGGTNFVTGFVGPVTIAINGKLNTALMSTSSHTLDVLIHTGAGGSTGKDKLVSPQLGFTVNANNQVATTTVNAPANTPVTVTIPGTGSQVTISLGGGGSGSVAVEEKTITTLSAQIPNAFTSTSASTATFTLGSNTATTAGKVFEIDTSALTFTGSITVTIPFDPSLVPSGSSPTLFRWTGSAWEQATNVDTGFNTITGTFTALSPVVAGVIASPLLTGSGGGGRIAVDITTYPDSHFALNPLAKIRVLTTAFLNAQGQVITQAFTGQQIMISSSFRNYQQQSQQYAYIVQIEDKEGFVIDLRWQEGTVGSGKTVQLARPWTATDAGAYSVQIFIWDSVSRAPIPLTQVTVKNILVQ